MTANEMLVASGLALLRDSLSLYVCQGIAKVYGDSWWTEGVLGTLVYENTPTVEDVRRHRRLPEAGTLDECAGAMDISVCLILLTKQWARIFGTELGRDHRGWAFELIGVRNANKHLGASDHAGDFAWRALDTMARLCGPINADVSQQLAALRSSVDLSAYGQIVVAPTGSSTLVVDHGAHDQLHIAVDPPVAELGHDDAQAAELNETLAVAGPDFSGADLQRMNFAGANLSGADFSDANLSYATLKGAVLAGAVFKGANLANADLTDADLSGAYFEGTTLSVTRDEGSARSVQMVSRGANLSGAILDGATLNFANSDLRAVNFSGVNLHGADFTGANLAKSLLGGAVLTLAVFKGANLANANLTSANLAGALFEDTILSATSDEGGARQVQMVSRGANLSGAILDGATLNFARSDLRSVNFSGVTLDGADFTDANLTGSNLEGASLRGVSLKGADIKGARTLDVQWI